MQALLDSYTRVYVRGSKIIHAFNTRTIIRYTTRSRPFHSIVGCHVELSSHSTTPTPPRISIARILADTSDTRDKLKLFLYVASWTTRRHSHDDPIARMSARGCRRRCRCRRRGMRALQTSVYAIGSSPCIGLQQWCDPSVALNSKTAHLDYCLYTI